MQSGASSHQLTQYGDHLSGALSKLAHLFTPTAWTTPLDLAGHRSELVRAMQGDRRYTRPFIYPEVPLSDVVGEIDDVRRELESSHPLHDIVNQHLALVLDETRTIHTRSDERLHARELELRPPDSELEAAAHRLLTEHEESKGDEERLFDAKALTTDFRKALSAYDLHAWRVELHDNMGSLMSVKGSERLVKIRSDVHLGQGQRNRLLAHEIGGHVLRWANAEQQPEPLVRHALGETIATEEGMAVAIEEQLEVSGPALQRQYAVRVLGVAAGQEMGLVELARYLLHFLPAEQAAGLALRLRRGFTSPAALGCRTKDQEYLAGWLTMRRIRTERPADWQLLRATKWPHQYLSTMQTLAAAGRITAPVHDPSPERLGIRH